MNTQNVRYQVKKAATMRIVSELVRRHSAKHGLYPLELHPAGGQSYAVFLFQPREENLGQPLASFRFGAPTLVREHDDANTTYLDRFLTAEDPRVVVDEVEAFLRLPHLDAKVPPTTPTVLMYRMMSAFLERHMFSRILVDAGSGFFDSSGEGGSSIRAELRAITGCAPEGGGSWSPVYCGRFWLLGLGYWAMDKTIAVLDPRGKVWWAESPGTAWDVYQEFKQNGRRVFPLVDKLEDRFAAVAGLKDGY